MKISVVLTTYNRGELLRRTLPKVFEQDYPAEDFEVVVVVDGSIDDTAAILSSFTPRCGFHVIIQENHGVGHARNTGARAASGDILLFLDDDIVCDRTVVLNHVAAHAGTDTLIVQGRWFLDPASPKTLVTELVEEWSQQAERDWGVQFPSPWTCPLTVDANTSLARGKFFNVGGYNARLRARENADIAFRLLAAGMRFKLIPNAVTYHLYVKQASALAADAALVGQEEIALCRDHPEYRPHSLLARLQGFSWSKRRLLRLAARRPVISALGLSIALAERLRRWRIVRRVGVHLIKRRQTAILVNSAVRYTGGWRKFDREFGVRLPVLLYHNVGKVWAEEHQELVVSPGTFRAHLAYLRRRGYCPIGTSDWLEWIRTGRSLPPKPVLITFDDGYKDLCEFALPALQEHGFKAVVFLPTQLAATPWDGAPLMDLEQVLTWTARGTEFGCHSRTHVDLRGLSGAALAEEVQGSGDDLIHIVGKQPRAFAYPYGFYSPEVKNATAGFELAFTTEDGLNTIQTDPLLMRRTMVQPTDSSTILALRLWLGCNPLEQLTAKVAIRTRLRRLLRKLPR